MDDGNVAAMISEWERGEITGAEATERTEGEVRGMEIKPAKFVEPIFTLFVEGGGPKPGQIFYEDDEMMIFPNVKEHTRQLQKAKDKNCTHRDTEGETASMSYVHMLAIPKKRIYNAVSLKQKDAALVRRMMEKAKVALVDAKTQEYYLKQKDLDLSTNVFDVSQLEFFMHCHPSHSVGHLHLHCCMRNLWTLNGSILSEKNMLVRHVLEVVICICLFLSLSLSLSFISLFHLSLTPSTPPSHLSLHSPSLSSPSPSTPSSISRWWIISAHQAHRSRNWHFGR
jgi:hypothetical protein